VLPELQYNPALGKELIADGGISIAVFFQLPPPEDRVALRGGIVVGATMPEASVNEDSKLRTEECHIRFPWDPGRVDAVSESCRGKNLSDLHLRQGVCAPDTGHNFASFRTRPDVRHGR